MLWSGKELTRADVRVRDGSLGPVRELYFDDAEWVVRHIIVRTSSAPTGDPHLRSFQEVTGYHIAGINGRMGHLEDMLIDDQHWGIRYLVVDTRSWWFGKQVLLLPGSVRAIDWGQRRIHVDLTRERIKAAPQWQPGQPLGRDDEFRLHAHYAMSPYWVEPRAQPIAEHPAGSPGRP